MHVVVHFGISSKQRAADQHRIKLRRLAAFAEPGVVFCSDAQPCSLCSQAIVDVVTYVRTWIARLVLCPVCMYVCKDVR